MKTILKFVMLKTAALALIGVGLVTHINCGSDPKQKTATTKTEKKETMQTVTSKDGTKIAYDKTGRGPAIILVTGALATRSDYAELAQLLAPHFTVYYYDRRGRGDSDDKQQYAVEREIEDIEAIIEEAGGPVYIYGASSGACLALEATAALGDKVKQLALYEAPYDEAAGAAEKWAAYRTTLHDLVAKNQRADAVEFHMKFVGATEEVIAGMKASPKWPAIEALAPTLPYDIAAVGRDRAVPVERAAKIKAVTLVMDGAASKETMPFMSRSADKLAKVIPNAQRRTIEGQDHSLDSKVLAPILVGFFGKN